MPFDAVHTRPAPTPRRIDVLAGCTVLGRRLNLLREGVRQAIALHRSAQVKASKPYASPYDRKPAKTRQDVLQAVARVRACEAEIEATYGAQLPGAR